MKVLCEQATIMGVKSNEGSNFEVAFRRKRNILSGSGPVEKIDTKIPLSDGKCLLEWTNPACVYSDGTNVLGITGVGICYLCPHNPENRQEGTPQCEAVYILQQNHEIVFS